MKILSFRKFITNIDIDNLLKNSKNITVFTLDKEKYITAIEGNTLTTVDDNYLGQHYLAFIYEEDRNLVDEAVAEVYRNTIRQADYRIHLLTGLVAHVHTTFIPIWHQDEVQGVIGITAEVHVLNEIEEEWKKSKRLYQHLIQHTEDITMLIEPDGTILTANIMLPEDIEAASAHQEKGNIFYYVAQEDHEKMQQQLHMLLTYGHKKAVFEVKLTHERLGTIQAECTATNHLQTKDVCGIICTFRDITELKRKNEEIDFLSRVDCLTGVYNRRYLEIEMNHLIEYARFKNQQFGFFIVDINNFNYLNNLIGHDLGDQLLVRIAQTLKSLSPSYIKYIGRLSGDQFGIVTHHVITENELHHIATTLRDAMEQQQLSTNLNVDLTFTMGGCVYPDGGSTFKDLLDKAGLALFMAKKEEVFLKIYSPTVSIDSFKLFEMENALKDSLQRDQFFIHYQPIHHINDQTIFAVEALLRWEHPKLGVVSPKDFIPLAEESGLIIELGEWVLDEICAFYAVNHLHNTAIKLTYNMSPLQFLSPRLIDSFKAILLKHQVLFSAIIIEVTETAEVTQKKIFKERVQQLKNLGFTLALDDFGTGYSSFDKILKLNPNYFKLDRAIIQNIDSEPKNQYIVEAIVDLAHKLQATVIAEGVETAEEEIFLRNSHVDFIQGYLYNRPLTDTQLLQLLEQKQQTVTPTISADERRQYFRVKLPQYLVGTMTIDEINGKKVRLGKTNILIGDIGPGGLRCYSNIKIPNNTTIILRFTFIILGEEQTIYGKIVYDEEKPNYHIYGITFLVSESERTQLVKQLNQLQALLINGIHAPDTHFTNKSILTYFAVD